MLSFGCSCPLTKFPQGISPLLRNLSYPFIRNEVKQSSSRDPVPGVGFLAILGFQGSRLLMVQFHLGPGSGFGSVSCPRSTTRVNSISNKYPFRQNWLRLIFMLYFELDPDPEMDLDLGVDPP